MLPTALYTVASIAGWLFGVITLYSATTSTYLVVANMLSFNPVETIAEFKLDAFGLYVSPEETQTGSSQYLSVPLVIEMDYSFVPDYSSVKPSSTSGQELDISPDRIGYPVLSHTSAANLSMGILEANLSSETHEVPVVVVPEGVSSAKTSPVSYARSVSSPEGPLPSSYTPVRDSIGSILATEMRISAGLLLAIFGLAIVVALVLGMIIGVIVGYKLRPQVSVPAETSEPELTVFVTPARSTYPDDPAPAAPSPMIIATSYPDLLGNTRYRLEGSGAGFSGTVLDDVFAPISRLPRLPPPRPNPSRTVDLQDRLLVDPDQRPMSNQRSTSTSHCDQRPLPNRREEKCNQRPLPNCMEEESSQRPLPSCSNEDQAAIIRLRRESPMVLRRPEANRVIGRSRLANEVTFDHEDQSDSDSSSCGPESPTEKHSMRRHSSSKLCR